MIDQSIIDNLIANKSYSNAVYAIGQHGSSVTWQPATTAVLPGQKFWCTESEVSNGWDAAKSWGPALNQNFIGANQTSTTSWSLIWSAPAALQPYQNRGAMMASTPWSGHYVVDPTV